MPDINHKSSEIIIKKYCFSKSFFIEIKTCFFNIPTLSATPNKTLPSNFSSGLTQKSTKNSPQSLPKAYLTTSKIKNSNQKTFLQIQNRPFYCYSLNHAT